MDDEDVTVTEIHNQNTFKPNLKQIIKLKIMGKVFSSVKHPFKNFNLESRAHKIISQPKPSAAPRFKKDQIEYERMLKGFQLTFMI